MGSSGGNDQGTLTRTEANSTYARAQIGQTISAVVDSTTLDQTAALNAEITALSALGGGVINLPNGTIVCDGIVLKSGVTLRGTGQTTLKAKAGGTAAGVILLAAGPVQNAWVEDLQVTGVGTVGQRGIYLKAVGSGGSPDHGGWWYSGLRRVSVSGFASDNIWLRGGGADMLKPHQFLTLERVISMASATGAALRVTGQVGQVEVIGGEFDGPGKATGTTNKTNVIFEREVNDALAFISDIAPYSWAFHGTTFQSQKLAVSITRAQPITLDGCYFEDLGQGIYAVTSAELVTVSGCSFKTTGTVGDGTGYVVCTDAQARVNFTGNRIFSDAESHLIQLNQSWIQTSGNIGPCKKVGLIDPAAPGGVTPTFWLRADRTLAAHGATLTSWADVISGALATTQGGAPAMAKAGLGGKAAVSFPGVSYLDAMSRSASSRPVTILAVCSFVGVTTNQPIAGNASNPGGGIELRLSTTGKMDLLDGSVALIGSSTTSMVAAAPYVLAVTFSPAGAYVFYRNGVPDGSGTNAAAITPDRARRIGGSNSGTTTMTGAIAEYLEWDAVLTPGQILAVSLDFGAKYGITI